MHTKSIYASRTRNASPDTAATWDFHSNRPPNDNNLLSVQAVKPNSPSPIPYVIYAMAQSGLSPAANTLADKLSHTAMDSNTPTSAEASSPVISKDEDIEDGDEDEMDLVEAGKDQKADVPSSAELDVKIDIKPEVKLGNLFDEGWSDGGFEGAAVPDAAQIGRAHV